jgi:hypothetical protein
MREYEIKFERWHEIKYVYFTARSVEEAKNKCYWAYGDLIDILNVEVFAE